MTAAPEDFNATIISEFRANAGKVGGVFENAPVLLLHHRGAKSGTEHVNPLVYQPVGDAYAIFASKGGAPNHPHWFLNLKAHPTIEVEVGAETVPVTARVLEGDERSAIWERQKQQMANFAEYEKSIAGRREIPVVLLERI